MNHHTNNFIDYRNNTTEKTIKELKNIFYISAKGAKVRDSGSTNDALQQDLKYNTNIKSNVAAHNKLEHNSWKNVLLLNDPKRL